MAEAADTVSVRLFAGLELSTPERCTEYALTAAEVPTVSALLARLGLRPGAAGLVLVNGVHARGADLLRAGDEVALFPPLGGG